MDIKFKPKHISSQIGHNSVTWLFRDSKIHPKTTFLCDKKFYNDFLNDYITEIFKAYFLGMIVLNKDDHIIFVTEFF